MTSQVAAAYVWYWVASAFRHLAINFLAAFFLMLLVGNSLLCGLKGWPGMKWSPREYTPDSHSSKLGVPSMGGLGLVGSALFAYFALAISNFLLSYPMSGGGLVLPSTNPITTPESIHNAAPSAFVETTVSVIRVTYQPNFVLLLIVFPAVVFLHATLGFFDDWSKATGRAQESNYFFRFCLGPCSCPFGERT